MSLELFETSASFNTLAGKGWRGARVIADKPGILPEAQHIMQRANIVDDMSLLPRGRSR